RNPVVTRGYFRFMTGPAPIPSIIMWMYVPTPFAEDRAEEIQAIMRSCSLPVLISLLEEDGVARMTATHLPLTLVDDRLFGHIARATEQWKLLDTAVESFAIFSGVDGYVRPSYYP